MNRKQNMIIMGVLAVILVGLLLIPLQGIWAYLRQSNTPTGICPCSVMVDGQVFYTFFEKADVDQNAVQIAGYIDRASCSITFTPQENDTSNFEACVGEPYAWADGDLILSCNGQWNICYWPSDGIRVMVNGTVYSSHEKPAPIPSDEQIAGHISSTIESWEWPTENDMANNEALLDQPYAWVNGRLVVFYEGIWYSFHVADYQPGESG